MVPYTFVNSTSMVTANMVLLANVSTHKTVALPLIVTTYLAPYGTQGLVRTYSDMATVSLEMRALFLIVSLLFIMI